MSAEKGDFVEALGFFERAIASKPSSRLSDYMAQCFMMVDGAEQKAVEAASAAVALNPSYAAGQLTLARANLNAGNFEEAVAAFEIAVALDETMKEETLEDLERARKLSSEKLAQERDRELIIHGHALRICQGEGAEGEGTGSIVGESSVVLAMYLERHATRCDATVGACAVTNDNSFAGISLNGCRALELGSGTGVAGLAAAALGARVLLTDTESALPLLRRNVEGNATLLHDTVWCGHAEAQAFDWTDGTCALDSILLSHNPKRRKMEANEGSSLTSMTTGGDVNDAMPQLVLAADVVFNSKPIDQLAAILQHLLSAGAVLLLAHKTRRADVDARMIESLAQVGIELLEVPHRHHHFDFCSPRIRLFWGHIKEAIAKSTLNIPAHSIKARHTARSSLSFEHGDGHTHDHAHGHGCQVCDEEEIKNITRKNFTRDVTMDRGGLLRRFSGTGSTEKKRAHARMW